MAATPQESWDKVRAYIDTKWDDEMVPVMSEYIKVPNLSPAFDPDFATNGLQEQAMAILVDWLKKQDVKGMKWELLEEKGRTPFLVIEIDGTTPTDKTLLMYGHMDKQPPLLPWAEGLHPYTPVYKDGRLYGRAGADDGYATLASLWSVIALQKQGIPHSRICVIIEADEESGSPELPEWINRVKPRLGDVDLVICLDSAALSYDRLWVTASLRGVVQMALTVEVLTEGIHSGVGSGAVSDSFRVLRACLDKIEDQETGYVKVPAAHCEIPAHIVESMNIVKEVGGFKESFPTVPGMKCMYDDAAKCALNNFWEPAISVIGIDGMPSVADGGNVLRPMTRVKLSMRTPPLVKCEDAARQLKEIVEKDPLYGAKVNLEILGYADGNMPPTPNAWLTAALNAGSSEYWKNKAELVGLGGTIPFMGMLVGLFPAAQFVITGVLGPQSNAHGPNEFLDVPYGKGINYCMARVVAEHYNNREDKK